jgi:hypothetical protein
MVGSLDDEPTGLRVDFDFFGEMGLVEERLRNPNAPRVSDPRDPGLRRHVTSV